MRLNKESNSYRNLIIHYTHEARLQNYNAIKTFIRRRPRTMLSVQKPQNMT
jgi:hypothetical protein